jgi:hypothetical protein
MSLQINGRDTLDSCVYTPVDIVKQPRPHPIGEVRQVKVCFMDVKGDGFGSPWSPRVMVFNQVPSLA